MNKKDVITEYEIRDALPIDPSSSPVPAEGFALAIEDFINTKFRGVASARSKVVSYAAVMVCTDYVAYFFKTLLSDIYGRRFLEITLESDSERLIINISFDGDIPLEDREMRNLIRLARNAGMNIYPGSDSIRLTLKYADAMRMRIYAISVNDGRRIMLGKMVELFYSGEPLDAEKPKQLLYPRKPMRKRRKKQ